MSTSPNNPDDPKPENPNQENTPLPSRFMPAKKAKIIPRKAPPVDPALAEELPKLNRLQEMHAHRKASSKPAFSSTARPLPLIEEEVEPPQEQFIQKMENTLKVWFENLSKKPLAKGKVGEVLENTKVHLTDTGGVRRVFEHGIIRQFFPENKAGWSWKSFCRTPGVRRVAYVLLLIFVSCVFYTCGQRNATLPLHTPLNTSANRPDFDKELDAYHDFLMLKNSGRIAEANQKLQALRNSGSDLDGLDLQQGEIHLAQKSPANALNALEDAIRKNESASAAHALLGYNITRFPKALSFILPPEKLAINHFQDAIKTDPMNVNAYILWGDFLQSQGNFEQALKRFEESRRVQGYAQNGKLRDIYIELCRKKLNLPAEDSLHSTPGYYFAEALQEFEKSKPEQAVASLRRAQELTAPEIYRTITSIPMFTDYLNDPKVKLLLQNAAPAPKIIQ
ncbi:MAG: hypothetical protein ABIP97_00770 [Chthoniobacterales bacterium]